MNNELTTIFLSLIHIYLMLFGSDCLVLFYESFSSYYRYTPLGYLEDTAGLVEALGRGDVKVTFQAS